MHCCLWFRSVFRVRGPWPKRYGYHLSIIYIYISVIKNVERESTARARESRDFHVRGTESGPNDV